MVNNVLEANEEIKNLEGLNNISNENNIENHKIDYTVNLSSFCIGIGIGILGTKLFEFLKKKKDKIHDEAENIIKKFKKNQKK